MKTLLILLAGEMAAPFSAPLQKALPVAFGDAVPEVSLSLNAPAGRSVAWVTLAPAGDQIELLLHTARIAGDLRRVLTFAPSDSLEQRASAVAFALANLSAQREADLLALLEPPRPAAEAPLATRWAVVAAPFALLDLPGVSWGGGLALRVERRLAAWISIALGGELALAATPGSLWLAPALMAEVTAHLADRAVSPLLCLGGGVAAWRVSRGNEQLTAWVPTGRAAAGVRFALGSGHAFQSLAALSLSSTSLSLQVQGSRVGQVGPASARLEFGYVGAF